MAGKRGGAHPKTAKSTTKKLRAIQNKKRAKGGYVAKTKAGYPRSLLADQRRKTKGNIKGPVTPKKIAGYSRDDHRFVDIPGGGTMWGDKPIMVPRVRLKSSLKKTMVIRYGWVWRARKLRTPITKASLKKGCMGPIGRDWYWKPVEKESDYRKRMAAKKNKGKK